MDYTKQIDYSSLSTYIECPRKFLFQYMLHFRSRRPSIHLVFGSCWHYGLEMAYTAISILPDKEWKSADLTEISVAAFNKLWAIEGAPHFEPDLIFPKSPGHAANMYNEYWKRYTDEIKDYKILAIEEPFNLDLNLYAKPGEKLPAYIGRMDMVLESMSDNTLIIVDHKTAKSVNAMTFTGYECSFQTDGYLTIGNLYYDNIPTMLYSVALCQKTKIDFTRFPIVKPKITIERFLHDLLHYIRSVLADIKIMKTEQECLTNRNDIISCFPRAPGYACTAYFKPCPYYDICKMRANPLLWTDHAPSGYDINEWHPDKHEENLKAKLKGV